MKAIDKSDSGKNQVKLTEKAKKEHIDAAFVYFSTACVEAPEFSMAYYKRGKCYMMMHDYKRALYDFSAAILNETRYSNKQHYGQIKGEGGNALFYMYAGQCNYYLGQYDEALAHYEIAMKHDPSDQLKGQILYNKGLANSSLMRY